ncbi:hypothetical protein [Paenirhodobacter sp. CAU 1674]|uniref:hypothetical protein n=1 Tax=Paenirhodobacter sp. CAU 1674 TaxID=3032596 RepID=UPI0023DB6C65|nr:hypothetical protein [Paenirhodobacter sp. CAU 1674]MDF2142281.1 hypothetical protein [Paenirhodobacter sp. CAU 1674]
MCAAAVMPAPYGQIHAAVQKFLDGFSKGKTPISKALIFGERVPIDVSCAPPWPIVDGKAGKAFCDDRPDGGSNGCFDWDSGTLYFDFDVKSMSQSNVKTYLHEVTHGNEYLADYARPQPGAAGKSEAERNTAYLDRMWVLVGAIAKAEARLQRPEGEQSLATYVAQLCALLNALEDFERAEQGLPSVDQPDGLTTRRPIHDDLIKWFGFHVDYYRLMRFYAEGKAGDPFETIAGHWNDLRGVGRSLNKFLARYEAHFNAEVERFLEAQGPGMSAQEREEHRAEKAAELARKLPALAAQELSMAIGKAARYLFPGATLPDPF